MAKKGDEETTNRGLLPRATQDEQLLESPRADEFTHTDPWRVFRIMGESSFPAASARSTNCSKR